MRPISLEENTDLAYSIYSTILLENINMFFKWTKTYCYISIHIFTRIAFCNIIRVEFNTKDILTNFNQPCWNLNSVISISFVYFFPVLIAKFQLMKYLSNSYWVNNFFNYSSGLTIACSHRFSFM